MRIHAKYCSLFTALLFAASHTKAQTYKNSLQIVTENDAYIDITKDRYYTNGLFINYTRAQPTFGATKKLLHINIAQKIFNPFYSTAPNPALHDRPFSAFLYAQIGTTKITERAAFNYYGQIGITGNSALGETLQKFYHNLVGQNQVVGWEYALKAGFGLNMGASYTYKLWKNKTGWLDIFGTGQLDLGSFNTRASLASLLRIGKINPMRQSASFAGRVSNNEEKTPYELFFFFRPQVNYIAFDGSLQGDLWKQNKGPVLHRPKPLTFSPQIGITFGMHRWILNYTVTHTSKEVKSIAPAYKYATIGASYCFN